MERTYQSKHDALVQRERNATERIQREQEVEETLLIQYLDISLLYRRKVKVSHSLEAVQAVGVRGLPGPSCSKRH